MSKLGIVFSGGGGKGAYEVGAWKALHEFGLDKNVEAVAGTSVGGLNGALFVQGDVEAAEKLWRGISKDQIMSLNKDNLARKAATYASTLFTPSLAARAVLATTGLSQSQGLFNQSGLKYLIEKSGACDDVSQSQIPFHVCALNSSTRKLEYPDLTDKTPTSIAQWLLASAAIPIVFDGIEIDGTTYFDGGVLPGEYSDNTPYKVLIEQHHCTHIINLYLERDPQLSQTVKQYPNVRFWNIVPTREFDGLIAPLNFTPENAGKLIDEGYEDVKRILEQFKDFQDTEEQFVAIVDKLADDEKNFDHSVNLNQQIRNGQFESYESLQKVTQQVAMEIDAQEQACIDSSIDTLIAEMKDNSTELLNEAFSAITTLASTEGAINAQLEQSRFGRVIGNLTGSNNERQAEVNHGLNRAIYANQRLIQKLNQKNKLTLEVVASLSNKTNYLMNHVNVLHGSIKMTEHRLNRSLALMKNGFEVLEAELSQQISHVSQRVDALERNQIINNWFHDAIANGFATNAYQSLLDLTSSFYLTSGRTWGNNELARYVNALKFLEIDKEELVPASLIWESNGGKFVDRIDAQYILPIASQKENDFPLLKGIQMATEVSSERDIISELESDLGLNLFTPRPAKELGLELLHAMRQNDRRPVTLNLTSEETPLLTSGSAASQVQSQWLSVIAEFNEINSQHLNDESIKEQLEFITSRVNNYKVVIPIIGKFSAGKSSLLNSYLGKGYLKVNIAPETAVATELTYGEVEQFTVHYVDDTEPVIYSLNALQDFQPNEQVAYLTVELNNQRLKNRRDVVLVDMPGFDARNKAHQKAIATYLERGDYFVTLFPADIPFDNTVVERLEEIYYDHSKDIGCLISKSARKSEVELAKSIEQVKQTLNERMQDHFEVTSIETQDKQLYTIKGFEVMIDNAASQFDGLLKHRYQPTLSALITSIEVALKAKNSYTSNTAVEIENKIDGLEQRFNQEKQHLEQVLTELEYNLCSVGREQLTAKVSSVLSNSIQRLVSAAKSNTLSDSMATIVRPVVQLELDDLIQKELARFERKLENHDSVSVGGISVHLEIPPQEKEKFSLSSGTIAGAISLVVLGTVAGIVVGILGGLLGKKKDNEAERDFQIEQQIRGQVIPEATSQIMDTVADHLARVVRNFSQQLNITLEQKKQAHNEQLVELQKQHKEQSDTFEEMKKQLTQALAVMSTLKQRIDND
ncbi:patatin-like phospholipase family protein [Pseudoalteromonas sp. T1lg10]|uniref:patatin-like phospholipase family protein n=1 Tax=Pseudoalteromonas sp. T1lg10 TaxID=2077093 RepID=UPI000CF71433|nr:patatin-like phospholipase family protein [Pseudoalteromonas sp. T1lg10]